MITSRELVEAALEFRTPWRAPRQLWKLPWAHQQYPEEVAAIERDYPSDFTEPPVSYANPPVTRGDPAAVGEYIDEWGCTFINKQAGVHGEVKEALIRGEEWEDLALLIPPEGRLTFDRKLVDDFCRISDRFVLAKFCARPFEQLQFIRGTEQLFIDLMLRPPRLFEAIERIHDFYKRVLTEWAKTEVDALFMMDDWGSQNSLLIDPRLWREIFKPLYREYVAIAHAGGKKIFMHSDGYILDIIPDLIELGVDALNSQLFCMGVEKLARFKGKITFWGEIDRQRLLPEGNPADIDRAVRSVKSNLWQEGGCIAQCEFGPGARPENVRQVFATWDEKTS